MSRLMLTLVAALAVVAAACSPQAPEITAEEQIPADQRTEAAAAGTEGGEGGETAGANNWVAVDIDYSAAPSELAAGAVEVELVNEGATEHNVTFEGVNDDQPVVEAAGGETATGSVELEAGDYTYFCSVPGHEQLMRGEVTVS
jgi:plastocyanin